MKQSRFAVLPVVASFAVAISAWAQEGDDTQMAKGGDSIVNAVVKLVDQCHDGFVCFGLDRDSEWDSKLIVDAGEMREATARVMKRYLIPADRSEDLQAK